MVDSQTSSSSCPAKGQPSQLLCKCCTFAYFHIPIQELSRTYQISCPGSDIPVQSTVFRSVHCTHGAHCSSKGDETDGHTQSLGYQFDLMAGRVRPIPDHWQKLQDKILEILSLPVCPVQQFMSNRFTNSHRKAISPRPTS